VPTKEKKKKTKKKKKSDDCEVSGQDVFFAFKK